MSAQAGSIPVFDKGTGASDGVRLPGGHNLSLTRSPQGTGAGRGKRSGRMAAS